MRKKRGKSLQTLKKRDRIVLAVTLIAMKREVATEKSVGFPWSTISYSAFMQKRGSYAKSVNQA